MKYIGVVAFGLLALCAQGQTPSSLVNPEQVEQDKLIRSTQIIGLPDSAREEGRQAAYAMLEKFYSDQYRNFQDPKAPYFMFMSKNADLAMGVGGVVRLRGWYGWHGALQSNGFSPYNIPIPATAANRRELNGTPAGTAIFLNIMAHKPWLGYLNAYVEANFNGYQHMGFQLKKAYVTVNDFTIGYLSSTYSDNAAMAPVIDGAGSNGKIDRSNLLVRYMHTFRNRWTVAASFEFPKSYISVAPDLNERCTEDFPDIAAMGQFQWDEGLSHVRVSALLRRTPYRNLVEQRNHNVFGFGLMLSGKAKIVAPLTLYASVSAGRGQGSYQGDLRISNYDLVPDPGRPGSMYAPRSLGITAGAKYNFRSNVYACAAFGLSQYYRRHKVSDSEYRRGIYAAVNVFWDLTPRLQVGAEYLYGRRQNFDGAAASADRIDALFQFSF